MPAHRKKPLPPARMVELLADAKRALLQVKPLAELTEADFDLAWDRAWAQMVTERAWPHNTAERRGWRSAMKATRSEYRATFLGQLTGFQRWRQAVDTYVPDDTLVPSGDVLLGAAVA